MILDKLMSDEQKFTADVSYSAPEPYVYLCASGSATPDDIKKMYSQAARLAEQHDIQSLLLDARKLKLPYDTEQIYEVVEHLAHLFASYKIARLIALDEFKQDLIEDMAEQKSLNLRNFESKTTAIDWLTES